MPATALLLLNLGTPDAPEAREVGKYLREFLMDPFVIDTPWPLRAFLVNVLIVPKRAKASAALYRKVWTDRGSPLAVHSRELAEAVQKRAGEEILVQICMRYGNPSIRETLQNLARQKISKIVLFPLYPQFSLAATQSSVEKVKREMDQLSYSPELRIIPPFYARPEYLDSCAKVSAPVLHAGRFDKVLFSFHGLPERHVKKLDASERHCLKSAACCDAIDEKNRDCYRAQCYATARELAKRLDVSPQKAIVCFQSRLGRTPWIRPYTDAFYRELPKLGVKRIAVVCPSFVADCLETLEEVAIRGREEFLAHGGEELTLIPSLNADPDWANAVCQIAAIPRLPT